MKATCLLLCLSTALTADAFRVGPATSTSRVCSKTRRYVGDNDNTTDRRSFLEDVGLMVGGAVAWTAASKSAVAEELPSFRPSAKGLAEASTEIPGSDKQPIVVDFLYPSKWTLINNPGKSVSVQDYKTTDRGFALVVPLPAGVKEVSQLSTSYFTDALFDLNGPYGTFGKVEDFKVIGTKNLTKGKRSYRYVDLKFAALTQGLLQVDRRACIACTIVGDDAVFFTASVLFSRWAKVADVVAEMIESFRASPFVPKDPSKFFFAQD